MSAFDSVPFLEATATTGSRRVLRYEHRMPSPWSLLAVVPRGSGSEPLRDECSGMLEHRIAAFLREILSVFRSELKASTKAGFVQRSCEFIEITHDAAIIRARSVAFHFEEGRHPDSEDSG
jgi:hypothetical protein